TNPHGGVVLAIDKRLNAIQLKIDEIEYCCGSTYN
ncbi:unnamed protein product, partial [Rotaria sp. Silwood2]